MPKLLARGSRAPKTWSQGALIDHLLHKAQKKQLKDKRL